MNRFCIVEFNENGDKSVDIVPECWFMENECWWPSYKATSKIQSAVRNVQKPGAGWFTVPCRVLCIYDSYSKARSKLPLAEETSDLASDVDFSGRHKKTQPSYTVLESSDEDCVSPTQTLLDLPKSPFVNKKMMKSVPQPETCGLTFTETQPILMPKNCCSCCTQNKAFQRKVLGLLERNNVEIKELKALVSATKQSTTSARRLPESCPTMPLETLEEITTFDAYLEDEKNFSTICSYLSQIGGFNLNDAIRRVLSTVMTNHLSTKFNWKGIRGEKRPFSLLKNINKLVFSVVHEQYGSVTLVDVNSYTKKWLMRSCDRDGGRSKRIHKVNDL